MEAMRESWTDDRLDYLNRRVEGGFAHVDERIGRFEKHVDERFDQLAREFRHTQELVSQRFDLTESRLDKMDARFEKVDARFERADVRFERMDERFHALHKLIIQGGLGLFGALFVAFLTFLATHI